MLLRVTGIAVCCAIAVYLTSAAFVPSMGTGAWDFLFIGFALLGLLIGAIAAVIKRISAGKRPEAD